MSDLYQHVLLPSLDMMGLPGPVAIEVAGWPDEALRNLDATDIRFGLQGTAFWPLVLSEPAFDPVTEILTDEILDRKVEPVAFRVTATRGKRALTADELAEREAIRNPVPFKVSAAQACCILDDDGLLDRVEALVKTMPRAVRIWFEKANDWERASPYVMGIGLELDLTEADLDEKFRRAGRRL